MMVGRFIFVAESRWVAKKVLTVRGCNGVYYEKVNTNVPVLFFATAIIIISVISIGLQLA